MDYFELFNIPKKINIDQKILDKNFYILQEKFHPDLFINDTDTKKEKILNQAIKINKGYKILKNFLNRSIYLMHLHGFNIKRENISNNVFLTKYFFLYEELENIKKNKEKKIKLNNFLNKINIKIVKYQNNIIEEFEKKNFQNVKNIIEKLLFLEKINIDLKKI